MNDPSAQMASQIGKTAFMTGSHYMEQNVREQDFADYSTGLTRY